MTHPDIDIFVKGYVTLQERIRRLADYYMRVRSGSLKSTVPLYIIRTQLDRANDSLKAMQDWARYDGLDLSKYDIDIPDSYY